MRQSTPFARPSGLLLSITNEALMQRSASFRPRGTLGVVLLVVPVMLVLAGFLGILLPPFTPLTRVELVIAEGTFVIGWLLSLLFLASGIFMTVHTSGLEIQIEPLFGTPQHIPWVDLRGVTYQAGFLTLVTKSEKRHHIYTVGLADGEQLLRLLVLRVQPQFLDENLRTRLSLLTSVSFAEPHTIAVPDLPIALQWQVLSLGIALAGTGLAFWGSTIRMLPLLLGGVTIALAGIAMMLILRQIIVLTDTGITVKRSQRNNRGHTLLWSQVKYVVESPLSIRIRLHSGETGGKEETLAFFGTFFLSPTHSQILRDHFRTHLEVHGIPFLVRWDR